MGVSDETILSMFDPANIDLLESIKKDRSLFDQLHGVTNNCYSNSISSSASSASSASTTITTNNIAYYRRDHSELLFSLSVTPSESPVSVLHVSLSSSSPSASSASSAYTTRLSSIPTTMATAAATVQYDFNDSNDDVFFGFRYSIHVP